MVLDNIEIHADELLRETIEESKSNLYRNRHAEWPIMLKRVVYDPDAWIFIAIGF